MADGEVQVAASLVAKEVAYVMAENLDMEVAIRLGNLTQGIGRRDAVAAHTPPQDCRACICTEADSDW